MGIGSTIGQVAQPTQSAPQPMGGKGGGLGTNPYAQSPSQPPQPMGGKGGGLGTNPYAQPPQPLGGVGAMPPGFQPNFGGMTNPYTSGGSPGNPGFQPNLPGQNQGNFLGSLQGLGFFGQQPPMIQNTGGPMTGIPSGVSFMSPRGATTGGPRTLPTQQQPQFDDKTTQAEFDRARGITPAEQSMQTRTPQALPQSAEEAFRKATTNVRFASSADMEAAKQDFMNQYNQRDALKRQYAMPGQDYRSVNPVQIEQMRQMQQPQFMGGKGGGFNPYAGGFGGGVNNYGGGFSSSSSFPESSSESPSQIARAMAIRDQIGIQPGMQAAATQNYLDFLNSRGLPTQQSGLGGLGGFGKFNPYAQRFFKDGGEVK